MAWYDSAYPGAPMVKVDGFPRPLYPPDATQQGKKPSVDGDDILAYKRTVWRAGRWQGPASAFDDSFSNAFSHGKAGGNVGESGIAGVQRQQNTMSDTGWVGTATFNLLRSIVIPQGPNAGQMAMDATAVKLLNAAFLRFGGHEPEPEPRGTVRGAALQRAIRELGTVESPSGSNQQPYGAWYGMDGVPWCAIFVTHCFEHGAQDVGKQAPSFIKGERYSYVPYVVGDARALRYGLSVTGEPQAGDLVCYDWEGDGVNDHIGIFEAWIPNTQNFTCLEGNTSEADQSNGGQVMRRTRSRGNQGTTFVRVAEPG